jgi:MoxR-like ATPase
VSIASASVTADRAAALDQINAALAGVDPADRSSTKYRRLETTLAELGQIEATRVTASTVSKARNFTSRVTQSPRAQAAHLFVGLLTLPSDLEATKRAAFNAVESGRTRAVLLLVGDRVGSWSVLWGVQGAVDSRPSPLDLIGSILDIEIIEVAQAAVALDEHRQVAPRLPGPATVPAAPLVLDSRVRRMLRTAVASRPAVMLVGPPGTGKSQLVAELIADVAADPRSVGMVAGHDPLIVTPDDSWTVRELLGGDTVDDHGCIRFTPGLVPQAISQDKWLVLDEANRADMDRIFGGLLTWLSGQHVTIGRTTNAPDATPVNLGWNQSRDSTTAGVEAITSGVSTDETVEYLAGTEWRLLGTYNALDAQRVFRFGLALGRRFAHVPVPPPGIDDFETALEGRLDGLTEPRRSIARNRILDIYEAHLNVDSAALGPGVFFEIPGYLAAGTTEDSLEELIAEAYLTSTGTWLARLEEDQLDQLGLILGNPARLGDEWEWIRNQLRSLR